MKDKLYQKLDLESLKGRRWLVRLFFYLNSIKQKSSFSVLDISCYAEVPASFWLFQTYNF